MRQRKLAWKPANGIAGGSRADDPDPNWIPIETPIAGQYLISVADSALGGGGVRPGAGAALPDQAITLNDVANDLCTQYGGTVSATYDSCNVFLATGLSDAGAKSMSHDVRVEAAEQDGEIEYDLGESDVQTRAAQINAPWGVDRIDQRDLPLNQTYNYTATGQGVNVYVLDSGVFGGNPEFAPGQVTNDWSFNGNFSDEYGHGTAVASIVGGRTYGVAKNAKIHNVRVLNRANSIVYGLRISWKGISVKSSVVEGMNWVAKNRVLPAVANLSAGVYGKGWGGWLLKQVWFPAQAKAMNGMIKRGVIFVCCAMNNADWTKYTSPADRTEAIVVGGTDRSDQIAPTSNWGDRVDVFAPGWDVPAADIAPRYTNNWRGTSFASPHVAGVAALYLQTHPSATQVEVENWIKTNATAGKINFNTSNAGGGIASSTANRLLFSNL